MPKIINILFLILVSCNCLAQESNNNFAKKVFLNNYKTVKTFVKYDQKTVPTKEIKFLMNTTGTESYYFPGIDITYSPTLENLKEWKSWYEINKRWDYQLKKIYLE